jgi:hypothetical protein
MHFVFKPVEKSGYKWWMNKIEELIDPLNVVVNGSQRLHGSISISNNRINIRTIIKFKSCISDNIIAFCNILTCFSAFFTGV